MKQFMFVVVLLAGMAVVGGCSGAGQGISAPPALAMGGVAPAAAHDPALVGTWSEIRATQDGVDAACRTTSSWPAGTVRQVFVLSATGNWIISYYDASGKVISSMTGTWSTSAGSVTLKLLSGGTNTLPYTVSGNVWTWTETGGGHTYVKQSAKEVSLTAHDPALIKTWLATGVWLNGVAKPLSCLTGSTSYPRFARSFLANGTSQRYSGGNPVMLPQPALQNWAIGGGVIKYLTGKYQSAIYKLASGTLTIWQLDAKGNTLKVVFRPYGAAGAHDARLVGTWHAVSGKVDGVAKPLAQIYPDWPPGGTLLKVIFWSDGTSQGLYYAGTTLMDSYLDGWYTTSGVVHSVWPGGGGNSVSYVVGTGSMTLSWTAGGHKSAVVYKTG